MSNLEGILLRPPLLEDGSATFRLIDSCPPLDMNSRYCNLLQCSHFADTSVVAEANGEQVGFISGYMLPNRLDTLFIWQVAVAKQARGDGLASRMLMDIIRRTQCESVRFIETTITEDNHASWALFRGIAQSLSTQLHYSRWIDRQKHLDNQHESELLVRIGPITQITESTKSKRNENF
ncbi:diaminobutyrate acetyltransferase [Microbulbifer discodermiae]|uniref:diaminobutyrate acetyltransferase n=1 Tax=Microbulbifer sp. 2201CG32-9 TaxID=3232309 RepID=UPI00345BCDAF